MTLADWRERLRTDPEGTVTELVRRFGSRRSVAPEVENLFWRVVVDLAAPGDLACAVLGRLRPPVAEPRERPFRLLDLDREHRVRLRGRLRVDAAEALRGVVRDREARERIVRHPSRLPEAAFALRGRPAEAAALYALEHDQLVRDAAPPPDGPGRADDDDGYRRLCRAALRYETARALHRVDDRREVAFEVMESVVRLIDEALEAPGPGSAAEWLPLAWRLAFHAREWLGFRHLDGGRFGDAEREFVRAAGAAPETDLAVAARMFAANAMIRDGRTEEARRLLDSLRIDTERLSPPMADEWIELRERLLEPPGGGETDADGEG